MRRRRPRPDFGKAQNGMAAVSIGEIAAIPAVCGRASRGFSPSALYQYVTAILIRSCEKLKFAALDACVPDLHGVPADIIQCQGTEHAGDFGGPQSGQAIHLIPGRSAVVPEIHCLRCFGPA